jgi:hypothetical protein
MYGILISPVKCVFRASEVTFLGYRVSSEAVFLNLGSVDPPGSAG